MTQALESLSEIITKSGWLAPILALFAGVLTSFTPCSLSSIPLVIGYVGGTGQKDTKRAFKLSLIFALGSAVTFTVLGEIFSSPCSTPVLIALLNSYTYCSACNCSG